MNKNLFLLLILAVLFSCNEEISVGSSLLEEGSIDIEYNDSIGVTAKTVLSDSVVVYRTSASFNGRTYLVGSIDDPVFGPSFSETYMSSGLSSLSFPIFDTLKIDSVILAVPLDTLGQFGKDNIMHDFTVFQLSDVLPNEELNSEQQFDVDPVPVAEFTTRINHRDSVQYYSPNLDSTLLVPARLRIPLDTMLWSTLARDTSINRNPDAYTDFVKGFKLVSNPEEDAMLGLDLSSNSVARIEFYYSETTNDTSHFLYTFDLGAIRSSFFSHDIAGTELESALNNQDSEYLYIQEMQGPNIVVDISAVDDHFDKVINRAILQLPALKETDPVVGPVSQLQVSYLDDEGNKVRIIDNLISDGDSRLSSVFGGSLDSLNVNGIDYNVYSIEITNHLNALVAGGIESRELIIESNNKAGRAGRSIILGPQNQNTSTRIMLLTSKP